MKRMLLYSLLTFLLVLLAACTQTQLAPPDEIDAQARKNSYRFSETTASAYFYDEDECSYTSVSVFVTEQKSKGGKAGGTEPWAYASIYHSDWCGDTYESVSAYGYGSLPKGAFKISGGTKSATLNTTITLLQERCYYDEEYGWFECVYDEPGGMMAVNLDWQSSGKATRYKSSEQYRSPDYRFHYRSRGTFRNAVASGNVTVSLDELSASFSSSDDAWIGKSTSGSMYFSDSTVSQAENHRFSGNTAVASYFDYDDCSYTSVGIFATESKAKVGKGQKDEGAWAYASIYHSDWCGDTYESVSAYGETSLPKGALGIGGGLKSATLDTTIELFQERCNYDDYDWWDCTYEPGGVMNLNLAWAGYGKTERYSYRSSDQYHSPDYRYKSRDHSKGAFRNATASGNVTVSLDELNTTFSSFDYAWLGKSTSGSMYVSK
jgi:hypothetical protein